MAAGTNSEVKKLTYWVDGIPSEDIQLDGTDLNKVTFWVDGMPYVTVFPSENTSAMMPFFWGIG